MWETFEKFKTKVEELKREEMINSWIENMRINWELRMKWKCYDLIKMFVCQYSRSKYRLAIALHKSGLISLWSAF